MGKSQQFRRLQKGNALCSPKSRLNGHVPIAAGNDERDRIEDGGLCNSTGKEELELRPQGPIAS
jgi:hypothetical protein